MENINKLDLSYFTGTEQYHPHYVGYRKILLTDGCKYVAEAGHAYWVFDVIVSYQHHPSIKGEEFQVWKLEKQPQGFWLMSCDDGNGNGNILVSQQIPFSDFPLDTIKLYVRDSVCMLPSEH